MNHLSPIVFDGESERCVLGSAKEYALGCVNFVPSGREITQPNAVVSRDSVCVTMLAHLSEFAGKMHFVIVAHSSSLSSSLPFPENTSLNVIQVR